MGLNSAISVVFSNHNDSVLEILLKDNSIVFHNCSEEELIDIVAFYTSSPVLKCFQAGHILSLSNISEHRDKYRNSDAYI